MTFWPFHLLLLIVVFAINFRLPLELVIFDMHRLLQVASAVLIVVAVPLFCRNVLIRMFGLVFQYRFSFLVALLVFILALVSALLSEYPFYALKTILNSFVLVVLCILLASEGSLSTNEGVSGLHHVIGLYAAAAFFLYYFQFFIGFFAGIVSGLSVEREVLVHHFSNIRFLNHIQVLLFPFLLVLSVRGSRMVVRALAFSLSVVTVSVLLFCSARAALGGMFIAATILFLMIKPARAYLRVSGQVLVLGICFFLLVFKVLPVWSFGAEFGPVRVSLESAGRWDLWLEALGIISKNWMLGVGGLQYSYVSEYGFGHPHNFILQIAVEYGVVFTGLVILLTALFLGRLIYKLKRADGAELKLYFPFVWSVLAILGVSMFSGVWMAPLTQLLIVVCFAPLMSWCFSKTASGKEARLVGAGRELGVSFLVSARLFLLACSIGLVLLVWPEMAVRNEGSSSSAVEGKRVYAPRFWQDDVWPVK